MRILKLYRHIGTRVDKVLPYEFNPLVSLSGKDLVLSEICRKYKNRRDPTFTQEEVHKLLQGLAPEYLTLNIRDLFKGSGLIEIDDNLTLRLNDNGIKYCENEQF